MRDRRGINSFWNFGGVEPGAPSFYTPLVHHAVMLHSEYPVTGGDMTTWKDISSWCKSEVDRTPKTWTFENHGKRVVVTRHRAYGPDAWMMSCYDLGMNLVPLEAKDIEKAKLEALGLVRARALAYAAWVEEGMKVGA